MTEEIGLKQPVEYTPDERRRIATHEAGHATVAHVVGKDRKLEVLSIIRRRDALGLLAHSDLEERFTKTRSEIVALIQIAMGGLVAEELYFGEAGTGPAGDLQAATTAAAQLVGVARGGRLAGQLRRRRHGEREQHGGQGPVRRAGPGRARGRSWTTPRPRPSDLAREHRHVLEALRDALLDRHELVGEEILDVIHDAEARHEAAVVDLRDVVIDRR